MKKMKSMASAIALLTLTAFAVPVFAAADVGEQQEINCPYCGEKVIIGRHGQAGQAMTCPKCGKEICAEKPGEEKMLCYGADLASFSKYVSRGVVTTDGPVFQPDLWASYGNFTFSVWGSLDFTDINGLGGSFNEADFALDYSGSLDRLSYSAGLVYYIFPHTGADDTSEVYAGVGYDVLLSPKIAVYYDFWQADGFYGAFSLSHGFPFKEVLKGLDATLDLSAQVGLGSKNFNSFNFGAEHTAFTDLVLTASLPVTVLERITVKPTVSYSTVLDRAIRTKNFRNDNIIFGGVVSASF